MNQTLKNMNIFGKKKEKVNVSSKSSLDTQIVNSN